MVGLIQKNLIDLVQQEGGAEAVAEVKRRAGVPLDRTFRIDTVYSDSEWQRLLAAALDVLSMSEAQLLDAYAEVFCRDALARFPTWFQMSRNSRELLERQPMIHNCFASGVRDPEARRAVTDKFELEKRPEELIVHYRSPNGLCGLYEALARWFARYYGERADIWQAQCLHRGDAECEIHVRWEKDSPA